jgi:GxxExxY protein
LRRSARAKCRRGADVWRGQRDFVTAPNERDPRTYAIIGAAMEVHRRLGRGFLEAVYQAALARELTARGIPFRREVELPVFYRGEPLEAKYRVDFICYDDVIVELKASASVTAADEAQLINYLRAGSKTVGLLLHFGGPSLEHRRYAFTPSSPPAF